VARSSPSNSRDRRDGWHRGQCGGGVPVAPPAGPRSDSTGAAPGTCPAGPDGRGAGAACASGGDVNWMRSAFRADSIRARVQYAAARAAAALACPVPVITCSDTRGPGGAALAVAAPGAAIPPRLRRRRPGLLPRPDGGPGAGVQRGRAGRAVACSCVPWVAPHLDHQM